MNKPFCDCKNRPYLTRVERVRSLNSTWDVCTYYRDGIESQASDGWHDKRDGLWPIQPFCRYRWLPIIKDFYKHLRRVK